MEQWRFITPVLVTINIFIAGLLVNDLSDLRYKVFLHLTNHDLHIPREQLVGKGEFDIQCKFQDRNHDETLKAIRELRADLKTDLNECIIGLKNGK